MPEAGAASSALVAHWREGQAIVNLRGRPSDEVFVQAVNQVLGIGLPLEPCRTVEHGPLRVVWAGPDDWFLIDAGGGAERLCGRLRAALAGVHAAVTDVSSGYTVLSLAGPPVREVLAQGCPLDLHARSFGPGQCAGTHFFKASVWLWQTSAEPMFELLVRRSFRGYVEWMLQRAGVDAGLVVGSAAAPDTGT